MARSSSASPRANSAGGGRYGNSEGDDDDDGEDRYPESVSSSVREHIYEGGMRYHAYRDGRYPFPK